MSSAYVRAEELSSYGLTAWHGPPPLMERSHRHNEVELNVVDNGSVTYLFGGRQVRVPAGTLAVFWATFPHQMVAADEGASLWWLTVPLAAVLGWQLPERLTAMMLHGLPVVDVEAGRGHADHDLIRQWHDDLESASPEQRRIVMLELEARLRRLCLSLERDAIDPAGHAVRSDEEITKVEAMALYIAAHYDEPLRVADVAVAVGLQANYAMGLFRRTFGMSMISYLTQYRIADAQRLLATTDATAIDVAMAVGFGSPSRFYEAFKSACGQTPLAYRASVQGRDGGSQVVR